MRNRFSVDGSIPKRYCFQVNEFFFPFVSKACALETGCMLNPVINVCDKARLKKRKKREKKLVSWNSAYLLVLQLKLLK